MAILQNKVAVVFAAGGAIGSEVSRIFAREGAMLFLSGRNLAPVETLSTEINSVGGRAFASKIDALDEHEIYEYLNDIHRKTGHIDIVFNAIGIQPVQAGYGTVSTELSYYKFLLPIVTHVGSQFLTSRLAAKYMQSQKSRVILTLSASVSTDSRPFMSNITAACAAIEGMTRSLAAELGNIGIRVVCLRPRAMAETRTIQQTYSANAKTLGIAPEVFAQALREQSKSRRPTTLRGVAELAVFLASDQAGTLVGKAIEV
jgi:NAD(P)-dependent dehydrogenase (short-subunit alcohol dehydrogenase family)